MSFSTLFGPLADKSQMDRVLGYIECGKKESDLIYGGKRIDDKGCFVEPTLFWPEQGKPSLHRKVFGPVFVVKTFKAEEAVALANNTDFGLSGIKPVHTL